MKWHLHEQQYVCTTHRNNMISFRHKGKCHTRGVSLTRGQFQNFGDIIYDLKSLNRIQRYPLGGNVWLCYYKPIIKLCVFRDTEHFNCAISFFQFYRESWYNYIKHEHKRICSFLKHVASNTDERSYYNQLHAADGTDVSYRPRKRSHNFQERHEVLSRSSGNGSDENEQQEKSTNVSKREDPDLREYFSFRRAYNAIRAKGTIEEDLEDGELSDCESDIAEHGSECEIE